MKPEAIVYTSNTGYTSEYAKILGENTGLPVYALNEIQEKDIPIIYLGWLMAGSVKGYKKAVKRFKLCAVCGVGMGATGSQIKDIKKANNLPNDMPIFSLQGGFDINKLKGIYKFMMNTMKRTAGKSLANKQDRTADEDVMLDLMLNGGSYVSRDNLKDVLDWYESISIEGNYE